MLNYTICLGFIGVMILMGIINTKARGEFMKEAKRMRRAKRIELVREVKQQYETLLSRIGKKVI